MRRLALFGSGDMANHILYYAYQLDYVIAGFFNDLEPVGKVLNGIPVLGGRNDVLKAYEDGKFDEMIIAIGYKHFSLRKGLFEEFDAKGIPFGRIIPGDISPAAGDRIGRGTVLLPGCVLDKNVRIGNNVFLNIGCAIAHDTTIGDHSFLSPRVAIAGFVRIGECCNIGINTTIIDNITIGNDVQTGGGTVVIKDLPEKGVYVGNPATRIR